MTIKHSKTYSSILHQFDVAFLAYCWLNHVGVCGWNMDFDLIHYHNCWRSQTHAGTKTAHYVGYSYTDFLHYYAGKHSWLNRWHIGSCV